MTIFEIRAKRIRAGLSPEKLGEEIGLDGKTVRNIEAGKKPSLATAHAFARWLKKDDVLDVFPELLPEFEESTRQGEAA